MGIESTMAMEKALSYGRDGMSPGETLRFAAGAIEADGSLAPSLAVDLDYAFDRDTVCRWVSESLDKTQAESVLGKIRIRLPKVLSYRGTAWLFADGSVMVRGVMKNAKEIASIMKRFSEALGFSSVAAQIGPLEEEDVSLTIWDGTESKERVGGLFAGDFWTVEEASGERLWREGVSVAIRSVGGAGVSPSKVLEMLDRKWAGKR